MTKTEKQKEKNEFMKLAIDHIMQRIGTARHAMENAQAAANEEDKSSVGDKYETSRAMGQIDSEMNARQLEEARRELALLQQIDIKPVADSISDGAVIVTENQTFFISTGIGILQYKKKPVVFISLSSPLGKAFANHCAGESITFNAKEYRIKEVY